MIQRQPPGNKTQLAFKVVIVATLISAFVQVTLGGVVRVTGSGLGCPDWPLCHGQIVPPFELATLIEWSHRLSGSLLGVLIIATTLMALVYFRSNRWVVYPSVVSLLLVIVAGILGGITVLTELVWWVRLIHLGIAEILVASMVFVSVAGWRSAHDEARHSAPRDGNTDRRFRYLLVATIAGVFFVILSGSYIVGFGAGSSCSTWPLCQGSLFPEGSAYAIHMGHRILAALVGVIIIVTAVAAVRQRLDRPDVAWAGQLMGIAFVVQVLLGAALVGAGFTATMKAVHLSVATVVWIAAVYLVTAFYIPQNFALGKEPRRRLKTISGLKRITP